MVDFTPFITERTRDFTGREWVFAEVDRWLADPAGLRIFLLTGGPGSGKTAVAARLAQMSLGQTPPGAPVHLGRGCLACFHFCQAQDDLIQALPGPPPDLPGSWCHSACDRAVHSTEGVSCAISCGWKREVEGAGMEMRRRRFPSGSTAGALASIPCMTNGKRSRAGAARTSCTFRPGTGPSYGGRATIASTSSRFATRATN